MARCEEGVSDAEHIAVTGDVYDVCGRLKELYEGYFVMLNRRTGKFEVHVKGQRNTLGCELPFDELDARTIEYVRRHDREKIDELLEEMDAEQEAYERAKAAKRREGIERMADGLAYLNDKVTDEFPSEAMR